MKLFLLLSLAIFVSSCKEYIEKEITNYTYFDVVKSDTVPPLLFAITDEGHLQYGVKVAYVNVEGDTIIPFGKYAYFGSDTLQYYVNVLEHPDDTTWGRWLAIDRDQNILFDIVMYDNGPDYVSEGFTRALRNGKMGFADKYGYVVIDCKYDFVQPFQNGKAKVTYKAREFYDMDEHRIVESDEWFYIDQHGDKVK